MNDMSPQSDEFNLYEEWNSDDLREAELQIAKHLYGNVGPSQVRPHFLG